MGQNCLNCQCEKCGRPVCITTIPLLSNLSEEDLGKISTGVSTRQYKKGEYLFKAGDKANKLYIVCSGRAKIVKHTSEGKEQLMYFMTEGDFFGAFNLLKEDEFDCTAEALEDTQVSMLAKSEFDKIILSHPEITLKVFEKAYERIMTAEKLVERLSTNSLDARVAGLLLNLTSSFGVPHKDGIMLKLTISREDMGSYAGIARETISRKLNHFQDLGLIELKSTKRILLKNIKALEDMI